MSRAAAFSCVSSARRFWGHAAKSGSREPSTRRFLGSLHLVAGLVRTFDSAFFRPRRRVGVVRAFDAASLGPRHHVGLVRAFGAAFLGARRLFAGFVRTVDVAFLGPRRHFGLMRAFDAAFLGPRRHFLRVRPRRSPRSGPLLSARAFLSFDVSGASRFAARTFLFLARRRASPP